MFVFVELHRTCGHAFIENGQKLFEHKNQLHCLLVTAGAGLLGIAVQSFFHGCQIGKRKFGIDHSDVVERIHFSGNMHDIVVVETPNDIARFKLNLAEYAQGAICGLESTYTMDDEILGQGYDFVEQKYDEAVTYMENNHVDQALMERAYEKISLFFAEDDYTQMYRWDNRRDPSKKLHYAKLYHALNKPPDDGVWICDNHELEYTEIATQAMASGDYKTAAECFDLIIEAGEEDFCDALQMADCYLKVGRWHDALKMLTQDLREYLPKGDKQYRKIIDLCLEHGDLVKAQNYCLKFIQSVDWKRKRVDLEECSEYTALLASLYWHYSELLTNKEEKKHYQQMAEDIYLQQPLLADKEGMAYFFLKSALQPGEKTNWARLLQSVKLFSKSRDEDMITYTLNQVIDQSAPLPRVEQRAAVMLRALDFSSENELLPAFTNILKIIGEYLQDNTLQTPYLRAKVQAHIAASMDDSFPWEIQKQYREQCDYRLLGQKDERRGNRGYAIERWLHYAEACFNEQPETSLYCYERALKLWAPLIDTTSDLSTRDFISNIFYKVNIYVLMNDLVEASQELERIERLLQSYRASGINSNWRIDPEYIAKSLAEQWEECQQPDRACRAWMLRALLLVEDEDVRCTILPELMTYDKGQLQERFIQLLQKAWDADTLDEIVSFCEKIFSLTVDTEPKLHSACETFLKHKRNDIIDFKEDL